MTERVSGSISVRRRRWSRTLSRNTRSKMGKRQVRQQRTASWACVSCGSRGDLASACTVQQIRIATRYVPVSRPRSLDAPFDSLTARGDPGIVTKQGQRRATWKPANATATVTILSRRCGMSAGRSAGDDSITWRLHSRGREGTSTWVAAGTDVKPEVSQQRIEGYHSVP